MDRFQPQKGLIFKVTAILCLLLPVSSLHAFNRGVILSPTRIVMEGRERAAIVKLINPDDKTNTYKISLVSMRMDDQGNRSEVQNPNPEEMAVTDMIRFSPRRATVKPKEWQTVRIMVRKPSDLAPGEYRAHLKVVPIPDQLSPVNKKETEPQKMSVHLDIVFSITIPIIIRHGKGDVEILPQKPVLEKRENTAGYYLKTNLLRKGLHSTYCNVMAYHIPLDGANRQMIGQILGLSIYTPIPGIAVRIPVDPEKIPLLSRGTLNIEIQDIEDNAHPLIGEARFPLDGSFIGTKAP